MTDERLSGLCLLDLESNVIKKKEKKKLMI